tara:strand:- start:2087 stop:2191 length:105 start_codon:yes stop_codon:yes gene_type:complete
MSKRNKLSQSVNGSIGGESSGGVRAGIVRYVEGL